MCIHLIIHYEIYVSYLCLCSAKIKFGRKACIASKIAGNNSTSSRTFWYLPNPPSFCNRASYSIAILYEITLRLLVWDLCYRQSGNTIYRYLIVLNSQFASFWNILDFVLFQYVQQFSCIKNMILPEGSLQNILKQLFDYYANLNHKFDILNYQI